MKILFILILLITIPSYAYGMHIMEGFLPVSWAFIWWIAILPFLFTGMKNLRKIISREPNKKILIAMTGAFAFVLSALKLPSVAGSCSHPTGVGFGAIVFGPSVMSVTGFIVLIFQALLLAHGGITTLGANTFSMGVAGPTGSYFIYRGLKNLKVPFHINVFLAASLGNMITYFVTALQLALAHPDVKGGFILSLTKFISIFAITQIPIAISEGVLTVLIMNFIYNQEKNLFKELAGEGEAK